jgi:hypothetical protein
LLWYAARNEILRDIMNASRGCRRDLFKECTSNFLQVLGGHKIRHDSWIHVTTRIGLALVYVRSHTCFPDTLSSAHRCPRNLVTIFLLILRSIFSLITNTQMLWNITRHSTVKVKCTLQQATKVQRGRRGIALLFL